MTSMQDNFISRDTQNNWNAGLNDPNPRMSVMAMEDGFVMQTAAFKDSIPMTNYSNAELGVAPPAPAPPTTQTFEAEEDESEPIADSIPGMKVEPTTPTMIDILNLFNDWAVKNVGYLAIGGVTAYALWHFGRNKE
tara:strand:- start:2042 stop:2449 length:408 start_codon:yes stop_codon:yes gene_type:complete